MRYIEFKDALKDWTVFSLNDIKSIDSNFFRTRLTEWQRKGYIKKLVKEYYIFSDLALDENCLFEIANRIYSPSYISFETALGFYKLIPESVYGISSASTRRTYRFKTQVAEFSYSTLKPSLFFGYKLIKYKNGYFKMADIQKAVLDYFYINTGIRTKDDFIAIRFDSDMFFEQLDEEKLYTFLERFAQKTLTKRIKAFLEFMKNA
jgi:predicted transcriptional regulator of viral defense system